MIARRLLLLALTMTALGAAEGLPEDISARLDGYETACKQLDAKAAEKLDKERQTLAKTLKRIVDRERKAGHGDVADAVQQKLDALGVDAKPGETPAKK
jgi:hypothetical protein